MVHAIASPVTFLAVLLSGLISGLLLGIAIEQQQLTALDAAAWTQARHYIDPAFGRILPWVWNGTLSLLIGAACLNHRQSRWMFATASILLFVGIVVTVLVELPINKAVASWRPSSIPANFAELRARWMKFHHLRTATCIVAFFCALVGVMQR